MIFGGCGADFIANWKRLEDATRESRDRGEQRDGEREAMGFFLCFLELCLLVLKFANKKTLLPGWYKELQCLGPFSARVLNCTLPG